jgi:hypothetical protein
LLRNPVAETQLLSWWGAVAGALALVSSLVFLRSGFKSLLHAVAAAALVYPLWFAYAIVGCIVGQCGYS